MTVTLEDVKRLRLNDGDTLVLRLDKPASREELEQIRDAMRDGFPDHRTVVLPPGMSLEVVEPTREAA